MGKAGGVALYKKYGSDHMRKIGLSGAISFWTKYKLVPGGIRNFLIVERKTGNIIGSVYRENW